MCHASTNEKTVGVAKQNSWRLTHLENLPYSPWAESFNPRYDPPAWILALSIEASPREMFAERDFKNRLVAGELKTLGRFDEKKYRELWMARDKLCQQFENETDENEIQPLLPYRT